MKWLPEQAEAIPFSRAHMAAVLGVDPWRVNNWIDRNRLWQTHRGRQFHRHYTLREVFDLAGFAAMRVAHVPEKECASYVYNHGFYGAFLHDPQEARFSFRHGKWDIGIYDPSAAVALIINMRTVGETTFRRLAEELRRAPTEWPKGSFESFRSLYEEEVRLDRIARGSAPAFEATSSVSSSANARSAEIGASGNADGASNRP
jgi:hypothetical protein